MEFEKLQSIIAQVLNMDPEEITMDSSFIDDLERIPWICFRLLWG